MKLSREDIAPLVVILAAGALGVAITASALDSRHEHVSVLRFEYSSPSGEWRATQPDRVEEIEVRRERQRIVRTRTRALRRGAPGRSEAVVEVRREREGVAESVEEIERALTGEVTEPELRALREELRSIERVRRRR